MKVIGNKVTAVNLSSGQAMTGKVLLGIAKQGPVYKEEFTSMSFLLVLILQRLHCI